MEQLIVSDFFGYSHQSARNGVFDLEAALSKLFAIRKHTHIKAYPASRLTSWQVLYIFLRLALFLVLGAEEDSIFSS